MEKSAISTILDIDRLPDDEAGIYKSGLEAAIDFYAIEETSFSHPKQDVINEAVRLLSEYKMRPEFLDDPEKCLFALAIADSWKKNSSEEEREALLTTLKLISVNINNPSDSGSKSDSVLGTSAQVKIAEKALRLIEIQKDIDLTAQLQEEMADRSEGSLLNSIRKRLGVENEIPFEIYVLNLNVQQMIETLEFPAMNLTIGSRRILLFGNDYEYHYKTVQHEYIHSQSGRGLGRGYGGLLGRALEEAYVENNTISPESYETQRRVLDLIMNKNSNYSKLFRECFMQRDPNSKELYKQLVKDFKLEGFLKLQRMGADIDNLEGKVKSRIFIDPEKVLKDLDLEEKLDQDLLELLKGDN